MQYKYECKYKKLCVSRMRCAYTYIVRRERVHRDVGRPATNPTKVVFTVFSPPTF